MDLPWLHFFVLVMTSFLTALISAVSGVTGGAILMVVMAQFFPPLVLIPSHGLIQAFSNASRAYFTRKFISWPIVWPFAIGVLLGTSIGSQMVVTLPEGIYRVLLGAFIIVVTILPPLKVNWKFGGKWFLIGSMVSFLGLFLGAVGIISAPFYLHEDLKKESIIASSATNMVILHSFKVATFMALGFALRNYLPMISVMIGAVISGSYCGRYLMGKIPEQKFRLMFKVLLVVLALRMIHMGLS